jgi:hypothetical protein
LCSSNQKSLFYVKSWYPSPYLSDPPTLSEFFLDLNI